MLTLFCVRPFRGERSCRACFAGSAAVALSGTVSTLNRDGRRPPPYDGDVLVVLSLRGFRRAQRGRSCWGPNYLVARPNIGIPSNALLGLDSCSGCIRNGATDALWQAGQFGAVHAVGQPAPTRSHFEATEEMERAAPNSSIRTGWLDRALGLRSVGPVFQAVQLGDSLPTLALAGPNPELALGSFGDFHLAGMGPDDDPAWAAPGWRVGQRRFRRCTTVRQPRSAEPMETALGAVKTVTALASTATTRRCPIPTTSLQGSDRRCASN